MSSLHCFFANVTPCPLVLLSSLAMKQINRVHVQPQLLLLLQTPLWWSPLQYVITIWYYCYQLPTTIATFTIRYYNTLLQHVTILWTPTATVTITIRYYNMLLLLPSPRYNCHHYNTLLQYVTTVTNSRLQLSPLQHIITICYYSYQLLAAIVTITTHHYNMLLLLPTPCCGLPRHVRPSLARVKPRKHSHL